MRLAPPAAVTHDVTMGGGWTPRHSTRTRYGTALLLTFAACGAPPRRATPPPAAVVQTGGVERPAVSGATPHAPEPVTVPLYFGRHAVLLADADCFDGPQRRVLGYRALPSAEVAVVFFLVGDEGVCSRATHARAELLLADASSAELKATCGAWRVEACEGGAQYLAVASPPASKVERFEMLPDWPSMDAQSDGLGEPTRKEYAFPVPGTSLVLRTFRSGVTVLSAGAKNLDAFRARAFILLDGTPHLVTREALVRLEDPPAVRLLRSLHTSDSPPEPEPHPWERQN